MHSMSGWHVQGVSRERRCVCVHHMPPRYLPYVDGRHIERSVYCVSRRHILRDGRIVHIVPGRHLHCCYRVYILHRVPRW